MNKNTQFMDSKSDDSRQWGQAMARGFARRCPRCGLAPLFAGYTITARSCRTCGLDFSGHEADDAPPYVTILIVGHIAIPAALAAKQLFDPPLWQQFAVWTPIILLATFLVLPLMKGALIGLQWANRMHGFAGGGGPEEAIPAGEPGASS